HTADPFSPDTAPAFCPQCGEAVIEKCLRCGADIISSNPSPHNCTKCGQRLRFDPDPVTKTVTVIIDP
ncbi:MAG: hypothetical protein ACRD2O_10340, partial [Terriglobia bacterium]